MRATPTDDVEERKRRDELRMRDEYLADLVGRAAGAGALTAEFGGDCHHVTIPVPDGTSTRLDACLFGGDAFTGDREHDMAPLPDAMGQTVDDMPENSWAFPTDPIDDIYGLLRKAAPAGASLAPVGRRLSHGELGQALNEALRNAYGPGPNDPLSVTVEMIDSSVSRDSCSRDDSARTSPEVSERDSGPSL